MATGSASVPRRLVDERVVFDQVRAGDSTALATLYRRHRRPVYLAAFSTVRSRSDAEEILQDTFVTMWARRTSIVLVGQSTLPWLVTTSRYLALNRLRSMMRRQSDSLESVAELTSLGRGPLAEAMLGELHRELQAAIDELSETDRAIVELCLVEDLSYKQAASRLGLTQAAVRNRLSRLRVHLRTTLSTRYERSHDEHH